MQGLSDKVVIITGAGSGLGRGMAQRFSQAGAKVAIVDIDDEGAQHTLESLQGDGLAVHTDISDYTACAEAVEQIENQFGTIDVLVNNAGWDKAVPFLESDIALWQKVVDINLYGPLNMHHVTAPRLIANGGGKIINIASDAGRVGSSGEAVYSACKGGVIAFGKALSRELIRHGVTINTVCPGPSDTPLFADIGGDSEAGERLRSGLTKAIPMRRLGTPEDVAGIVAFLASDEANFIVGQTISVSGGLTMHG